MSEIFKFLDLHSVFGHNFMANCWISILKSSFDSLYHEESNDIKILNFSMGFLKMRHFKTQWPQMSVCFEIKLNFTIFALKIGKNHGSVTWANEAKLSKWTLQKKPIKKALFTFVPSTFLKGCGTPLLIDLRCGSVSFRFAFSRWIGLISAVGHGKAKSSSQAFASFLSAHLPMFSRQKFPFPLGNWPWSAGVGNDRC